MVSTSHAMLMIFFFIMPGVMSGQHGMDVWSRWSSLCSHPYCGMEYCGLYSSVLTGSTVVYVLETMV